MLRKRIDWGVRKRITTVALRKWPGTDARSVAEEEL
jgi:hypothetical protein